MVQSRLQDIEALLNSEERYRVLFELSPVAVYSIDASGVIQEFNRVATELWGRTPVPGDTDERFCGSFRLYRTDGTYMPHAACPMAQVVSGEILEARDAEVIIERPEGSRITVIVNIRPLKGPDGDITGAINCFYDITERHRIEIERQQQNAVLADLHRRKDEFLAMLGHELRNPLAPILNAVHLLRLRSRTRTRLQLQHPRHHRAPGGATDPAGRRPAGSLPHHHGQDPLHQERRRRGRHRGSARSRRSAR